MLSVAGNVIVPVCWLVRSFVRYARRDFSKSKSPDFHKMSLLAFERSRSKFKVKYSSRIIARPWSSPIRHIIELTEVVLV